MDRQQFLQGMPFLLPTSSLPKASPVRKIETLIQPQDFYEYKVSVEPLVASLDKDGQQMIKPAFFVLRGGDTVATKNNNSSSHDPSMANIQIIMDSPTGYNGNENGGEDPSVLQARNLFGCTQHTNESSDSTTASLSSDKKDYKNLQLQSQLFAEIGPHCVYFKIEEGIFRVDGRQLMHLEFVRAKRTNDSQTIPPFLLLVFPCCVFRIFPLPIQNIPPGAETHKQDWTKQAEEALKGLEKRLLILFHHNNQTAAAWSPAGSSVQTSSNEAGQNIGFGAPHHQSHSHSTLTSSASSRNNKKLKAATEFDMAAFQDKHQIRKIRRCRGALERSHAGLQSLEIVLGMPLSCKPDMILSNLMSLPPSQKETTATDSAMSEIAEPRTQLHGNSHLPTAEETASSSNPLSPLMTGVADELASAYGNPQEVRDVMHLYQHEIDDTRHSQLDNLLNSFFPEKRHAIGKNRRHSKSKRSNKGAMDADDEAPEELKSAEETIASTKKLMQKQRELVEERSSLLMLPTRV